MLQKEFDAIVEETLKTCKDILIQANKEYADDTDKLANFKDAAKVLGVSPEMVGFIYLYKHIAGIANYVRTQTPQRDSFEGRITDAINYLILLKSLHIEYFSGKDDRSRIINEHDALPREYDPRAWAQDAYQESTNSKSFGA